MSDLPPRESAGNNKPGINVITLMSDETRPICGGRTQKGKICMQPADMCPFDHETTIQALLRTKPQNGANVGKSSHKRRNGHS